MHLLPRGREPVPPEGGAEDRVASDHSFPGLAERGLVERLFERPHDLLEIDARRAVVEAVEEHPFLCRRQLVRVFDVAHDHTLAPRLPAQGTRKGAVASLRSLL
jgi:hypothetical protein